MTNLQHYLNKKKKEVKIKINNNNNNNKENKSDLRLSYRWTKSRATF
ncbi:hypothetical protein ACMBCM_09405 [Spiroplasma sp. K1]